MDSVNPNEAPQGYYAVLKPTSEAAGGNICRHCDWRKTCQDSANTDFLAYGHRCMSYTIRAFKDGKLYQREDGCSVLFKKTPTA